MLARLLRHTVYVGTYVTEMSMELLLNPALIHGNLRTPK